MAGFYVYLSIGKLYSRNWIARNALMDTTIDEFSSQKNHYQYIVMASIKAFAVIEVSPSDIPIRG